MFYESTSIICEFVIVWMSLLFILGERLVLSPIWVEVALVVVNGDRIIILVLLLLLLSFNKFFMVDVELLKSDVELLLVELDFTRKSVTLFCHGVDSEERYILLDISAEIQEVDVDLISQELSSDIKIVHNVVINHLKIEGSFSILLMHVDQESIPVKLLVVVAQLAWMVTISILNEHKVLKSFGIFRVLFWLLRILARLKFLVSLILFLVEFMELLHLGDIL